MFLLGLLALALAAVWRSLVLLCKTMTALFWGSTSRFGMVRYVRLLVFLFDSYDMSIIPSGLQLDPF
jgi:hypothetical protein